MSKSKGMSQILVLITAAAVLMMVGLLLVTIAGDSFGETDNQLDTGGCATQANFMCEQNNIQSGNNLNTQPAACSDEAWQAISSSGSYECP